MIKSFTDYVLNATVHLCLRCLSSKHNNTVYLHRYIKNFLRTSASQKLIYFAAFFVSMVCFSSCRASETWIDINLTSYHTKPSQHLNQENYGLGVEHHMDHDVRLMTGAYRNSYDKTSVYALAGWVPLQYGIVHAGAVIGLINGYPGLNHGHVTKAIAGLIGFDGDRYGANIVVIPPALKESPVTFGLQVKCKF